MNVATDAIPDHLMWEEAAGPQAKNTMGKDDFMKLLLTQMKNQDPLKPTDQDQFAAQLAQFGSLEKLSNIETGIKGMQDGFNQESKLQALGMIGKNVKAWGNSLPLKEGKTASFSHALGEDVRPLRAAILDQKGVVVRNIDLTGVSPDAPVQWDGKDEKGNKLLPGSYNFRITGVGKDGAVKEMGSQIEGKVVGVDVQAQVPTLVVETGQGTQSVEVYKVSSVSLDSPEAKKPGAAVVSDGGDIQELLMKKALAHSQANAEPREEREEISVQGEKESADDGESEEEGFRPSRLHRAMDMMGDPSF